MHVCVRLVAHARELSTQLLVRVGDFPPTQMIYNKLYLVSRLVFAGDNIIQHTTTTTATLVCDFLAILCVESLWLATFDLSLIH